MEKLVSTKVTVDIPPEEYNLLNIIKDETGKSIRALVSEGVPLVLIANEGILQDAADAAGQKAEMIRSTVANFQKDKK